VLGAMALIMVQLVVVRPLASAHSVNPLTLPIRNWSFVPMTELTRRTFTLQAAGVSWKVYQGSDNFGDNGAEYFATFAQFDPEQGGTPAPGNVFYDNGVAIVPEPFDAEARNGDNLALAIKNEVLAGTLPQVSWVVTNQAYSEHPDGAPNDGSYYVYQVLQALNADPAHTLPDQQRPGRGHVHGHRQQLRQGPAADLPGARARPRDPRDGPAGVRRRMV
jgi:hypothetical protein